MSENGWVEPRLTDEEAQTLLELYDRVQEEQQEQFEKQGMSNTPASYKSLIRSPIRYAKERYKEYE